MKSVSSNQKHSTRDVILLAIKEAQEATVNDLAGAADVSPVTVRHHLNTLQADGLLTARAIRRKVGRPYFVYSLSEAGHELFPKRYAKLSSRLITAMKDRFPPSVLTELFSGVVENIIEEHRDTLAELDFEARLSFLVKLLAEEGFLARWEKEGDEYRLIEYSCPYLSVGEKHAEICSFDSELILSILETEVAQHSCMLAGDGCCEFTFAPPANGGANITLLEK